MVMLVIQFPLENFLLSLLKKIGSQSAHNILNTILSGQVTEIVTTLDWMLNIAYGGNTTTLLAQTECVAK